MTEIYIKPHISIAPNNRVVLSLPKNNYNLSNPVLVLEVNDNNIKLNNVIDSIWYEINGNIKEKIFSGNQLLIYQIINNLKNIKKNTKENCKIYIPIPFNLMLNENSISILESDTVKFFIHFKNNNEVNKILNAELNINLKNNKKVSSFLKYEYAGAEKINYNEKNKKIKLNFSDNINKFYIYFENIDNNKIYTNKLFDEITFFSDNMKVYKIEYEKLILNNNLPKGVFEIKCNDFLLGLTNDISIEINGIKKPINDNSNKIYFNITALANK